MTYEELCRLDDLFWSLAKYYYYTEDHEKYCNYANYSLKIKEAMVYVYLGRDIPDKYMDMLSESKYPLLIDTSVADHVIPDVSKLLFVRLSDELNEMAEILVDCAENMKLLDLHEKSIELLDLYGRVMSSIHPIEGREVPFKRA